VIMTKRVSHEGDHDETGQPEGDHDETQLITG
jgi:hypothetical protein